MSLKSPDDWAMLCFYGSRIAEDLAQHIADCAVGLDDVPDAVVATYADITRVNTMLRALHADSKNQAMYEVTAK